MSSRAFLLPFFLSLALAAAPLTRGCHRAHAEDKGQWNAYHLSDDQKAWFKTVRDSRGNTCDGADGYPVDL
jgi:hypothetical protein